MGYLPVKPLYLDSFSGISTRTDSKYTTSNITTKVAMKPIILGSVALVIVCSMSGGAPCIWPPVKVVIMAWKNANIAPLK